MCLIIHKSKGADVPKWIIESAQEYNQDGVGLMANGHADKWLKIGAGKLRNHILRHEECAVHFRMATHGVITRDNVHPFKLANGGHLMHNGILWNYTPKSKWSAVSDTACFVHEYVNPMLRAKGSIDLYKIADESFGSALAIMQGSRIDRTGTSWVEHEGLHMSNTYAWDAPAHLVRADSYDIHGDTEADGATVIDAREFSHADRRWWENEMRSHDGVDHPVTVWDPAKYADRADVLEERLVRELLIRSDEIDFADYRLQSVANSKDLAELLAGELPVEEFIESADADTLLEMSIQLARGGK